jgi:hydroxymethylglutaryl-CoA lyase
LGFANCYAALNEGAEYFETAFGGLGGCPFTKVAAGNVSSEDFVHSLQRNNMRKDININKILEVSKDAEIVLQKKMESYVFNSGLLSY